VGDFQATQVPSGVPFLLDSRLRNLEYAIIRSRLSPAPTPATAPRVRHVRETLRQMRGGVWFERRILSKGAEEMDFETDLSVPDGVPIAPDCNLPMVQLASWLALQ
jgi:hypothetical protein